MHLAEVVAMALRQSQTSGNGHRPEESLAVPEKQPAHRDGHRLRSAAIAGAAAATGAVALEVARRRAK
jgi:hypothetical protein